MITAQQLADAYDADPRGTFDYVGDPAKGYPAGKVTPAKRVFTPGGTNVGVYLSDRAAAVQVPAADLS